MRRAISLVFMLSCAVSAFAAEETRREFQKTVTLPAGRSFQLDHSFGNVSIHKQSGSEASIHASIQCSADTKTEAEQICSQIQIVVDESATAAKVRTDFGSTKPGRRNRGFQVNYDIALPERTPVDVRDRFGDVTMTDLNASLTVHNNNGTVRLLGGQGRRDVENSFGNVEVRSAIGDVTIKNNNGWVTVFDANGAVDISNRFGSVNVTGAGSRLTINGANANIDVRNVGGDVSIVNTFGPVTIAEAKGDVSVKSHNCAVKLSDVAGDADVQASFKPVTLSRIGGDVSVRAENASATGNKVGGDATIATTFGSIALEDIQGNATATATTSSIRLNTIEGSIIAKSSFKGIVVTNARGPITVVNQNGSVTVEPKTARCQPISVNTTLGPISVTLNEGVGYNLDARTTLGSITNGRGTRSDVQDSNQVRAPKPNPGIRPDGNSSARERLPGSGDCDLRLVNQHGNITVFVEVQKSVK